MKDLPLKQVVHFGFVGVVTLLIDVTVTTTLYSSFHVPAYLASGIGFLSGFFFNFPMNRKRVFHHSERDKFNLRSQILMYVSLSLFNLLATSLITQLLVSSLELKIAFAKVIVTAVIAVWNFIIFKTLVFSKREPSSALDTRVLNDVI